MPPQHLRRTQHPNHPQAIGPDSNTLAGILARACCDGRSSATPLFSRLICPGCGDPPARVAGGQLSGRTGAMHIAYAERATCARSHLGGTYVRNIAATFGRSPPPGVKSFAKPTRCICPKANRSAPSGEARKTSNFFDISNSIEDNLPARIDHIFDRASEGAGIVHQDSVGRALLRHFFDVSEESKQPDHEEVSACFMRR